MAGEFLTISQHIKDKMSRVTPKQIAALDILDWLYFNQILVLSIYSENDQKWLKQIVDHVIDSVAKTGATGLKAEYLKHGVLCLLEIFLADDMEKFRIKLDINVELPSEEIADTLHRIHKYHSKLFSAWFIASGELARGESMSAALEIASDLQEQFCDAPASIRHRLAERCMAYEFKEAPLDFFTWLAELQVIRCGQYQSKNRITQLSELVIARIGLMCEFEILRRFIGRKGKAMNMAEIMLKNYISELPQGVTIQLLENKHQFENMTYTEPYSNTWLTFDINRRLDSTYIAYFFTQVSRYFHRIRLWQGTLASWVGTLGGFMVEMEMSCSHTKKSIYVESNNKGSITDDVSTFLHKQGFSIAGRALYERHRHFAKEIKSKVLFYYKMLEITEVAPPPENEDMYYYSVVALSNRLPQN